MRVTKCARRGRRMQPTQVCGVKNRILKGHPMQVRRSLIAAIGLHRFDSPFERRRGGLPWAVPHRPPPRSPEEQAMRRHCRFLGIRAGP